MVDGWIDRWMYSQVVSRWKKSVNFLYYHRYILEQEVSLHLCITGGVSANTEVANSILTLVANSYRSCLYNLNRGIITVI